jgi:chromosomal replication initiator protein
LNDHIDQINQELHRRLRLAVDEATYRNWLAALTFERRSGRSVVASVPPQSQRWVDQRFGGLIQRCLEELLGEGVTLELTGRRAQSATARHGGAHASARTPSPRRDAQLSALDEGDLSSDIEPNPRLTFDQFIIGECNRLAHGAALTVAEMPGQRYNPLFICGPPGVGKTHLLHSIAGLIRDHNPTTVVRLTASEPFTNRFLTALQGEHLDGFKQYFRRVDVLMVDDIQFLQRKTRTEEEFFHTFNALYEVGAQVIVTSDRPPRDLQGLEDRLRERFEAGLVADIAPPDETTRTTIVRKRIHDQAIGIADPAVVSVLVDRITTSVRALEGALIRVVAFASLTGRPINVELVEEVLATLYSGPPSLAARAPARIPTIQSVVCGHFELSVETLVSGSRERRVTWPRQLAVYLARELTQESLPAIGRQFGGRDHSTVLYACRKAERRLSEDPTSRKLYDELRARVLKHTPR